MQIVNKNLLQASTREFMKRFIFQSVATKENESVLNVLEKYKDNVAYQSTRNDNILVAIRREIAPTIIQQICPRGKQNKQNNRTDAETKKNQSRPKTTRNHRQYIPRPMESNSWRRTDVSTEQTE